MAPHRLRRLYCNENYILFCILVSEFAREMAAAHEQFALEIQKILCTFRSRSEDLKNKRY